MHGVTLVKRPGRYAKVMSSRVGAMLHHHEMLRAQHHPRRTAVGYTLMLNLNHT